MLEVSSEISPTTYDHDSSPGPCPGCSNFLRCKLKLLACDSFSRFVRRDPHWSSGSRSPIAEIYRAVYA